MAEWPVLLLIADACFGDRVLDSLKAVLDAVPPEEVAVMDRWKPRDGPVRARFERLAAMARVVKSAGARLWVSGRPDLAVAVEADGVHLPEQSADVRSVRAGFPSLVIGRSCHDRHGLERERPDYALLSPIAAPHSKPLEGEALGVDGFARLVSGLEIPVYALGGIGTEHARSLRAAGAAGLGALGGVLGAPEPAAVAKSLLEAWYAPDRQDLDGQASLSTRVNR